MAVSQIPQTSYLQSDDLTPTKGVYTITYEQLMKLFKSVGEDKTGYILSYDNLSAMTTKLNKVYDWYMMALAASNEFKKSLAAITTFRPDQDDTDKLITDFYQHIDDLSTMVDVSAIAVATQDTALERIESEFSNVRKLDEEPTTDDIIDKLNEVIDTLKNINRRVVPEEQPQEQQPNDGSRTVKTTDKSLSKLEELKKKLNSITK